VELSPSHDLVIDELGNYYIVKELKGKKLTLINAMIHLSFNRYISDNFVNEVREKYNKPVAVGQYFQDELISKLERLKKERHTGNIYSLSDLSNDYEIVIHSFYGRK
jgi:hypothetical protein